MLIPQQLLINLVWLRFTEADRVLMFGIYRKTEHIFLAHSELRCVMTVRTLSLTMLELILDL